MTDAGRDRDETAVGAVTSTEDGPALRDADATARRIAEDEAAADVERGRLAVEPLLPMELDEDVRPHVLPGEQIHDLRRSAMLQAPGGDRAHGYGGTLYLTSRRLIHLGQVVMAVQLADIVETSVVGERLLLALRGGEGMTVQIDRPRQFRVRLAASLRALDR